MIRHTCSRATSRYLRCFLSAALALSLETIKRLALQRTFELIKRLIHQYNVRSNDMPSFSKTPGLVGGEQQSRQRQRVVGAEAVRAPVVRHHRVPLRRPQTAHLNLRQHPASAGGRAQLGGTQG